MEQEPLQPSGATFNHLVVAESGKTVALSGATITADTIEFRAGTFYNDI